MLALVPPGSETEKVAVDGGACTIAPMDDAAQVEAAIERVLADHFAGRLPAARDWPRLEIYDRLTLGTTYAECLNAVRHSQISSSQEVNIR
jgi:hypothetical protein